MTGLSAALPLLFFLLLRAARVRLGVGPAVWARWADVVFVVGVAVVVTVVAAGWYAPAHLVSGDWVYHDFPDYCALVGSLVSGEVPAPSSRSPLLAHVVAGLSGSQGVFDALARGAWLGSFLVSLGLVGWSRVVAGRLAAVAAGIVALAVAPIVLLTRTPTFYPLVDGVFVVGAALSALALRGGTAALVVAAATVAGLAGLVDARGLVWAAVLGAAALIAAVLGPPRRPWSAPRAAGRVGLVLVTLAAMWSAGRLLASRDECSPLEGQLFAFARVVTEHNGQPEHRPEALPPGCDLRHGYCWGWTTPTELGPALTCALDVVEAIPSNLEVTSPELGYARWSHLEPWRQVVKAAGCLALVGLLFRPRAALGLVLPALPFLLGWDFVARTEIDPRRLAPVLLVVPVFVGVATAVVVGKGPAGPARREAVLIGVGAGAWLLLVSGTVPTWWGPAAAWRVPWAANDEHLRLSAGAVDAAGGGRDTCAAVLADGPAAVDWASVVGRGFGAQKRPRP